jgi:hypothetical protein
MSSRVNCRCGAPLADSPGRTAPDAVCASCGGPSTPGGGRRGRMWLWAGLGTVLAGGLTGGLYSAVDRVREAAARSS